MQHLLRKLLFLSFVIATSLHAQSTYGTITGIVSDPSGAAIVGAKVEAVNQGTNDKRNTATDSQGVYTFPNLVAGSYTINVTSDKFTPVKNENIQLLSREIATSNVQLQIGGGSATVEVTGDQAAVSVDPTISTSTSGDEINSFALNFRASSAPSPIVVANLAPNVQSDASGNITIAGGLPTATSFSIDGISTQLPRYGGPTKDLFPSVEGISEFRVNSAGNDAQYAQPTDLTVISRNGTNQIKGSAYWYLQRKNFNAADGISHQVLNGDADTFGVSIGGPVVIPKLYNGKNKSFFYFDYEGIRLSEGTLIDTNVPPTSWRAGDLSGAGTQVYYPYTSGPSAGLPNPATPVAGNKIPSNLINPVSAQILNLYFPSPTVASNNLSAPNLVQNFPGTYKNDGYDGRFDQAFGEKHRMWFRVTKKDIPFSGTDAALGAGGAGDTSYNPLLGTFSTVEDLLNIAGSYNWVIKPNLLNEFTAGYTRANFTFSYPQASQGNAEIAQLGITGLPGPPKNGLGGVPVFYIGDFLGGASNPYGHPRVNKNGTLQFGDNLSYIAGTHNIKFGGEWRKYDYQDNITFNLGDEYGDYFFAGSDAQAFTSFLVGRTEFSLQAQNGPDGKPYGYHYGFFGQDEWRIRPNFSLHYGLRYEVNTPYNDQTHQLGNFDTNVKGGELVVQGSQGLALINPLWREAVGNTPFVTNTQVGLPITLRNTFYHNIQPRLGFSWSPGNDQKTVIRASSGIYSVPVMGAVLYSLLGVDTSYFGEYPSSVFPNAFPGTPGVSSFPGYRRANSDNLKDPRVIQWNMSIDHSFGAGSVLRASYIGSHTTNLIYSPDLNQVQPNTVGYSALTATTALRQQNLLYPNFDEVLTRANGPSAKYEAATLEFNRRFSNDLTFQTNYTWAKNITNALGTAPSSAIPSGGQGDNGGNVQDYFNIAQDTGNADFTRRHRFIGNFVYDLPFGRGKKYASSISRAANLAVGGWRVTGVLLLQTGPWLTPYYPSSLVDSSGTNPSQRSVAQQRPDCVSGQNGGYLSNPTTSDYYNLKAFSIPGANIGRYGNCGVGILEGPGTQTFSMSAGKTIQITERFGVRYEAQFANVLNILNKGVPNTNVASGSFGLISQAQGVEQGGPRTIQMMVRILF